MDIEDLTKQRIDFEALPGGGTRAILTVSLNDGSIHRFTADATDADLDAFASALATGEADAVEGFFGDAFKAIKKGVKKVAHVALKVATNKVFQIAAGTLATVATGGAALPAVAAAAAALSVASKLANADVAKAAGAPKAAAKLVKAAATEASKRAKGNPAATADLLRIANAKRKNLATVITSSAGHGARPAPARPAPARPALSSEHVLAAARSGSLRSNQPGSVSSAELLAASKAGRIFWTTAA